MNNSPLLIAVRMCTQIMSHMGNQLLPLKIDRVGLKPADSIIYINGIYGADANNTRTMKYS